MLDKYIDGTNMGGQRQIMQTASADFTLDKTPVFVG